jgi:hypothetical protein
MDVTLDLVVCIIDGIYRHDLVSQVELFPLAVKQPVEGTKLTLKEDHDIRIIFEIIYETMWPIH